MFCCRLGYFDFLHGKSVLSIFSSSSTNNMIIVVISCFQKRFALRIWSRFFIVFNLITGWACNNVKKQRHSKEGRGGGHTLASSMFFSPFSISLNLVSVRGSVMLLACERVREHYNTQDKKPIAKVWNMNAVLPPC